MKRISTYLVMACFSIASAAIGAELDTIIAGCNDCHGKNGVSLQTEVPTIAGLSMFYHSDQLIFFSEGERPCGETGFRQGDASEPPANMCDIARALSEDDFDAIAEHYAALPFMPAEQDFDAELAAAGAAIHESDCVRCHSDGGANPDDDAGILAGQWMGYLRTALAEFRSGEREQLDTMKENIDALSDEDIEALLHYYASQQ
ncbi:MAG: c-type cytochrome [Woeseiaceae bacterium]